MPTTRLTLLLAMGALSACAHAAPSRDVAAPLARPSDVAPTILASPSDPALMPSGARMLSGSWTDAPPAERSLAAFDADGDSLTFRGFAAVGFDRLVQPDNDGATRVSAMIDPVRDDVRSLGWLAFVFTPDRDGAGWPTNREHTAAILVRSNGAIQVFSRGNEYEAQWEQQQPAPASEYRVALALRVRDGALVMEGSINEASFTARLGDRSAALGGRPLLLELCAHYHESPTESRVSALRAAGERLF